MTNSLMTVTYADGSSGIFLTAYADTVVYDTVNGKKMLCAIRFGGYPEQVDGMTQAIHGGGSIEVNAGGEKLILHPLLKKYQRKISHDGVYAEAVLIAGDDTRQTDQKNKEDPKNEQSEDDFEDSQPTINLPPRDSYIYTAPGDDNALYEAIDRQTGVPMIPEFAGYILAELKREKILTQLTKTVDRNIIEVVAEYAAYVRSHAVIRYHVYKQTTHHQMRHCFYQKPFLIPRSASSFCYNRQIRGIEQYGESLWGYYYG